MQLFGNPAILGRVPVQVNHNTAQNGIEVIFSGRPESDVLEDLKGRKFRWSRRQKLWYKRYTESDWNWAKELANKGGTITAESRKVERQSGKADRRGKGRKGRGNASGLKPLQQAALWIAHEYFKAEVQPKDYRYHDPEFQGYTDEKGGVVITWSWTDTPRYEGAEPERLQRRHKITASGSVDSLSDRESLDGLKAVPVQSRPRLSAKDRKPKYDLSEKPKIRRNSLFREMILGKIEAMRVMDYRGDGFDTFRTGIPHEERYWFNLWENPGMLETMLDLFRYPRYSPSVHNGLVHFEDYEMRYFQGKHSATKKKSFDREFSEAERAGIAAKLREKADNLEDKIEAKRNPAIAQQNPTARRARIAKGMEQDGDRLAEFQAKLYALADLWDQNAVPVTLRGIRHLSEIEFLYWSRDEFPNPNKPGVADWWKEDRRKELRMLARMGITDAATYTRALEDFKRLEGFKLSPEQEAARMQKELESKFIGRKIDGFFPTPRPLAEQVVDLAGIEDGMRVLEPSAGMGNLAEVVRDRHPGAKLEVLEIVPDLAELLRVKGFEVVGSDFLSHTGSYDRIVMNPPFERSQDAEHVRHAFDLLAPGGRLVAIMGEGLFFRKQRKDADFRDWLDEVGADNEKLPEDSFKGAFRSTGVRTRLVWIDKPGETATASEPVAPEKPQKSGKDESMARKIAAMFAGADRVADALGLARELVFFHMREKGETPNRENLKKLLPRWSEILKSYGETSRYEYLIETAIEDMIAGRKADDPQRDTVLREYEGEFIDEQIEAEIRAEIQTEENGPEKSVQEMFEQRVRTKPRRIPKQLTEGRKKDKILFAIQEVFKRLDFIDLVPLSVSGKSVTYGHRNAAARAAKDWADTTAEEIDYAEAVRIYREHFNGGRLVMIYNIAEALITKPEEFKLIEHSGLPFNQVYRGDMVNWFIAGEPPTHNQPLPAYFVLDLDPEKDKLLVVAQTAYELKGFWAASREIFPRWYDPRKDGTVQRTLFDQDFSTPASPPPVTPPPAPKPPRPKPAPKTTTTDKPNMAKKKTQTKAKAKIQDRSVELKLISSFINLDRKRLPQRRSVNLLKRIQREIRRGNVRSGKTKGTKPTPLWKKIAWIQEKLVWAINNAFKTADPLEEETLKFDLETVKRMTAIVKGVEIFPSVLIALRFIGMQRKAVTKDAARKFLKYIQNAEKKGRIKKGDPGAKAVPKIRKALETFIKGRKKYIAFSERSLDGLTRTLEGCGCKLHGHDSDEYEDTYVWHYWQERGFFSGYLDDWRGNTVWEIHDDDFSEMVQDGFMRHADDLTGLESYLIDMGVIGPRADVIGQSEGIRKGLHGFAEHAGGSGGGASLNPAQAAGGDSGGVKLNPDGTPYDPATDPKGGGTADPATGTDPAKDQTIYIVPPPRGSHPVAIRADQPRPDMTRQRLNFTGRWEGLFHRPGRGFTALLWGKPKNGKSTLAIDFADYLSRNFGTTLYASLEEDPRDMTFQDRKARIGANHPDLILADHLPADLSAYDFVFVDSISRGKMGVDMVEQLVTAWPRTSFIFISQVTNEGLPRGGMVYQHLVDYLVNVDKGNATADGRYGPGEMPVRFE